MAKSLEQKQREYELDVWLFEQKPPKTWFHLGYLARLHEELKERGYVTLAMRVEALLRQHPKAGEMQ